MMVGIHAAAGVGWLRRRWSDAVTSFSAPTAADEPLALSWAAFAVHAALFLRPGGRMGPVLLAELLSVNYAAEVRRFLFGSFARVDLMLFTAAAPPPPACRGAPARARPEASRQPAQRQIQTYKDNCDQHDLKRALPPR